MLSLILWFFIGIGVAWGLWWLVGYSGVEQSAPPVGKIAKVAIIVGLIIFLIFLLAPSLGLSSPAPIRIK